MMYHLLMQMSLCHCIFLTKYRVWQSLPSLCSVLENTSHDQVYVSCINFLFNKIILSKKGKKKDRRLTKCKEAVVLFINVFLARTTVTTWSNWTDQFLRCSNFNSWVDPGLYMIWFGASISIKPFNDANWSLICQKRTFREQLVVSKGL